MSILGGIHPSMAELKILGYPHIGFGSRMSLCTTGKKIINVFCVFLFFSLHLFLNKKKIN